MRIYQVDAFTDRPFTGNPAGVCILPEEASEEWMQAVAAEMNLSETAFLRPIEDGYGLRWFTPSAEVELCGHATLASAHVLWETGQLSPGREARFQTLSGLLTARRVGSRIEMDFPAEPASACQSPAGLEEALAIRPVFVGRNRMDYLLEVASETELLSLEPDFGLLRRVEGRGFIVTSIPSTEDLDFVSRFFAPAMGVDEDPVTGSAHCCLGPFWGARLGKKEMKARQVSRRGGELTVKLAEERVLLSGSAITVMRCELLGPEGEKIMSEKKTYIDSMQAHFDDICSQLDGLLGKVESGTRGGYDRLSRELKDKKTVVEKKLKELRGSSEEAWEALKPGLEKAWNELRESVREARSRF